MNNEALEIDQSLQSINPKILSSYEVDSKYDSELDRVVPEAELIIITRITERIYLGNKHGVNEDVLNQYGIKYVINLADELNDVLPKGFFCYKISHFKKYTPSELYDEIFEEFYNTLLSIPSSEKVFIHCKQGKSRSAAMVIGFIMRQFRVDYKKGLHWVKTKRPLVEPNQRFSKWLKKVNLNDFYARAKPVPITSSKEIAKHFKVPVEGYYAQFGQSNRMEIKYLLVDLDGVLKATGLDPYGKFFMIGNIDRIGNISLIKQYVGKHSVLFNGKLAGKSIQGKWDILGTGDEFNIDLKMDKWSGNGSNSENSEELKIDVNLNVDENSGDVVGFSNYNVGTNFIYGKADGEKIYFIQQYLGGGDMYIFELNFKGKFMGGTWKNRTGITSGKCKLYKN